MTSAAPDVLGRALRRIDDESMRSWPWEALVRRAREGDLMGTLAFRLAARGLLDRVPAAPRAHLVAALTTCAAQQRAVRREVAEVVSVLTPLGLPTILLKGAAYLMSGLPPSHGRLFSDIDILVPEDSLPAVESALMLAGYATTCPHPYDQRYYRRWGHELPPMQHVKRMTMLDVHHAIVPRTARVRPDAAALIRAAVELPEPAGVFVLAPHDMVLHSATHLFHNEELTHGLRDLVDIDALLGHFGSDPRFWGGLTARAAEQDLGRPLYYALRWATRILGTKVPDPALSAVEAHAPGPAVGRVMEALLGNALVPDAARASTRWARRAIYVRGHYLKMPIPLLAWHLLVKSLRREPQPA